METKYLHIAIDNEIQAAYDKGFQAGVDAVLNEPFPEHGDGGRVITKEELKFLDEDVKPEPQQQHEVPAEGLFSEEAIPEPLINRRTGFASKKHRWTQEMLSTLETYALLGFDFQDVAEEMFDSYGLSQNAVYKKLNNNGFRVFHKGSIYYKGTPE